MWKRRAKSSISLVVNGKDAESTVAPGCDEKPVELLEPVVPDSPQFSLQQSLAIDADDEFCLDLAFLQHAGRFGIGQEFSGSCAGAPIALLRTAARRRKIIEPCLI